MSRFRPGELCTKFVNASVILVAFSRLFAHHSCMKKVIIRNVCAALSLSSRDMQPWQN